MVTNSGGIFGGDRLNLDLFLKDEFLRNYHINQEQKPRPPPAGKNVGDPWNVHHVLSETAMLCVKNWFWLRCRYS